MSRSTSPYTVGEEVANTITHGLGALLAAAGLTSMVIYATAGADPYRIIAVSIFGATLILAYLASTLYHGIPHRQAKDVLRVLDHCAIFLLIAGTYTPFLMVLLGETWIGWALLVGMWAFALAGCTFKAFFTGKGERLSLTMYIGMGWAVLFAIKPAIEIMPLGAIVLLLLGGLAYTFGVVFYVWEKLPYNHAIWHLFVIAGSALHFAAVMAYVVPIPELAA
ncbi:MAG: hemolysin III family protein [Candidatus Hydrogenedens sp.]|nr:hemolysin III family protein [Candidatus Hydrogenedens sp.]